MMDQRLRVIAAILSFLLVSRIEAQDDSFWKDTFRQGWSYDAMDLLGPARWSTVGSNNNNNNVQGQPDNSDNNDPQMAQQDLYWGEWDYVGRMQAAIEDSNDLLLNFYENECGREAYPSPIELIPTSTCTDQQEIKVRQFNPYIDCLHPNDNGFRQDDETTQPYEITPYSLRYYYPRSDRSCLRPSVRLDEVMASDNRNEEHFALLWMEVHARSEHVVNGQRYDAELQMVHMGTTRPNELVVVSVMIQADATEDHDVFQKYLLDGWQRRAARERYVCRNKRQLQRERQHLRRQQTNSGGRSQHSVYQAALHEYVQEMVQTAEQDSTTTTTTTSYPNDSKPVNRRQLKEDDCVPDIYGNGCEAMGMGPRRRTFPYSLWPSVWYYSYTGSLTSPPCAGQVHWRIIDTPLSISRRQYKQMTSLLTQSVDDDCRPDSAVTDEGENFRPLQNATLHGSSPDKNTQDNKNDKNNNKNADKRQDDGAVQQGAPQTVAHCTADSFQPLIYSEGEQ